MQVRQAARIARVLIIIHLVLSIGPGLLGLFSPRGHTYMYRLREFPPSLMLRMLAGVIAVILLDAALLIVFGALCRTKEQQIMDSEE